MGADHGDLQEIASVQALQEEHKGGYGEAHEVFLEEKRQIGFLL